MPAADSYTLSRPRRKSSAKAVGQVMTAMKNIKTAVGPTMTEIVKFISGALYDPVTKRGGSSEEGSRVWHFEASPRTLSDIVAGRDSRPVEKNSRRRQGTEAALETVDLNDATEPLYQSRRRVAKKARLFEPLIWSPFKLLKVIDALVMRLQKFLSNYIMVLVTQGRYSIGFINIDARTRT
uniref:Uncharacterized protein n=1 Tax=Trichogramma kaykai TaxID=54128 RepID=A0ABD2X942_9HYME